MMSLEELHALWAEDDDAKMAIARKDGPRGWLVDPEGRASVVLEEGGELIALPLDES